MASCLLRLGMRCDWSGTHQHGWCAHTSGTVASTQKGLVVGPDGEPGALLHPACAGRCRVREPATSQPADARSCVIGVSGVLSRAILHRGYAVGSCDGFDGVSRHVMYQLCWARLAATAFDMPSPEACLSHHPGGESNTCTRVACLRPCSGAVLRWLLPLLRIFLPGTPALVGCVAVCMP